MTRPRIEEPARPKPFRLWPGVVIVALQWLAWLGAPVVAPEAGMYAALGGLLCGLCILVWWAFFSRAPHVERWGALVLMIVALAATPPLLHESLATAGMGMLFFVYAVPVLSLAFVAWAALGQRLATGPRRLSMVATILLACGAWTLVRTGGITGSGDSDFAWRWSPTPEERLLARAPGQVPALSPNAAPTAPSSARDPAGASPERTWPGFRGPRRDGVVRGVRIETDWSRSPPVELWRRPVGPGWSSFAVGGDLVYTQEQRGDDEVVTSYHAASGEPVWRHRDETRFWESNGGPGPRATPALSGDRLYTLGATGIVNALDSRTGAVVWSRNAAADTGANTPIWGFSASPLVVGDVLVVAAADALVAYDLENGEPRWLGPNPTGDESYSSPHLATIDGVRQVLVLGGPGATSVAVDDGTVLWEHGWPGAPIVQPALLGDGELLVSTGGMGGVIGTRRIAVARGPRGWSVAQRWTSNGLKPYFNDLVVHRGHAYGFDGAILACIDLENGGRRWKGGRYGHGQLLLLADQDLLLVLSERGELALVAATPDRFTEIARFPALEGKTWNHPVLVGGTLLVRNGQEMAAFRLSLQRG